MFKLKDYITESKNVHMEHLEDLVFNEGVAGTRKAINFLQDLRDMLAGHSKTKITSTVKWDGAPAIFAGVDPRDGKFFVAKKGVFNKDPKVYKTNAEIIEQESGLEILAQVPYFDNLTQANDFVNNLNIDFLL